MLSTYAAYQLTTQNIDRSLTIVKSDPMVERETAYYLENVGNIKTAEDFVNDSRIFQYAMKAFGLEDMSYAKAFMLKVLKEGTDESTAFANRLADKRYVDFAETFNFSRHGETATTFTKAQKGTVDLYMRQTLEENEGAKNEAVRLAMYFERKAPDLESVTGILADSAMSTVVRTILGLPESTAMLDIDKQIEMLEDRIDITDFQDPDKLAGMIERFSAMWDMENGSSTAESQVGLLFSGSTQTLSADMLMSLLAR
ncbi:DUF1217 domain-containing protein [Notoacmeibacter sp. MSK16QG-6]|uniref:DUF1217 domain-containing protein n=1 Tax=Notoacmeibacter sp. MSK16QG-6 TaxID=2957982 RepID=UPI00209FF5E1|nr:DUF1217 domain-containing protein [Notoacmeibacter sp. MSK16QG-6]MCP1200909.1 DUF1217 domain-containing protein [Notoacmeibacter sp. MSK16QG-6]